MSISTNILAYEIRNLYVVHSLVNNGFPSTLPIFPKLLAPIDG